jgi:hypothetical protein
MMTGATGQAPAVTDLDAVIAAADSRHAHHEAGHAVAAVARGGFLVEIVLPEVDWSSDDIDADAPGYARHQTKPVNAPFVTFAGPWAEARWSVEHDPEIDSLDDALDYAWINQSDGDGERYDGFVNALDEVAASIGLSPVGRAWEWEWRDELDELWPAVCAVAAALLAGEVVTHERVQAAVDAVTVST